MFNTRNTANGEYRFAYTYDNRKDSILMITCRDNYFYLETEHTSYVMRALSNGILQHVYYGAKISQDDFSYYNLFGEHAFSPLIRVDGFET